MKNSDTTTLLIVHLGLCLLLIVGIFNMPYGYYQFLRLLVILGCLYSITLFYNTQYKYITIIYVLLIVIFNPAIKLAFSKEQWKVIDGLSATLVAVLYVFIMVKIKPKTKEWDFSSLEETPKRKQIKDRIRRKIQERRDVGEPI